MSFDVMVQPRGVEVRRFRQSIIINGRPCTQRLFAEKIGIPRETLSGYESEKNGALMPAPTWTLARITWNGLAHAEWQKIRPKHE